MHKKILRLSKKVAHETQIIPTLMFYVKKFEPKQKKVETLERMAKWSQMYPP